jgi:hypothetical protein
MQRGFSWDGSRVNITLEEVPISSLTQDASHQFINEIEKAALFGIDEPPSYDNPFATYADLQAIELTPGAPGAPGPSGPQGEQGLPGGVGPQGPQGIPGADGYTPIKGVDYFDGENGAIGSPGYSPIKGIDYFDGVQGLPGNDGADGPAGPKGDPGDPGPQGIQGIQGLAGSDGAVGQQGIKGDTGDDGPQGIQGIQGPPGNDGAPGTPGVKGDAGDQGPQGIQGIQGIQGPAGPTVGYCINVQALTSSPGDGATVYFGMLPKAPIATANVSKVYIRKAGTIKIAEIYCYSGTAGTAENWSLYIRKNNTTDYLIQTKAVNTNERVFSNTSLNIPMVAGDYFEIKSVQPTWATNPLTCIYGGYVYVE